MSVFSAADGKSIAENKNAPEGRRIEKRGYREEQGRDRRD